MIEKSLGELQQTLAGFESALPVVRSAGERLCQTLAAGGTVFTCGNGGSAAQAMHLAEELTGKFDGVRRPLRGVCLNSDGSVLTCIANEFGYDRVFARQLEGLARPGDALVALSTSGNSPNVRRALQTAKTHRLPSLLLTGQTGGMAAPLADHLITVPSERTARVQEVHTFVLHAWLETIEAWAAKNGPRA